MNIIKDLTDRIENYRKSNKNPCKNYKTESAAEKAVAKMAAEVGEHFGTSDARYVVFFIQDWGRWVGAIDMNELLGRSDCRGGYLGLAASNGFYTY